MIEIAQVRCEDRKNGWDTYSIRLLHEFSNTDDYLTKKKIAEIWKETSKHDVLFSDYTEGNIDSFLTMFLDPCSVWLEIFSLGQDKPVGVGYITKVIPHFDADAHFAFWDSVASGREPIIKEMMKWFTEKYRLHRITAKIPVYQKGTIRFTKRLGFVEEGRVREGVIHKGDWVDLLMLGILADEVYNE